MDDILMSIARAVLNGVLDEISKQLNIVETQVLQVLQGFVKDVVGGSWQGPDADSFVSKVNTMLPKVQDFHQRTGGFRTAIDNAATHIAQTDTQAQNQVSDLVNTFSGIY